MDALCIQGLIFKPFSGEVNLSKENMLRVRFSDAEFEALKQLAEDAGCTMSELVRDHLWQGQRAQQRRRSGTDCHA